MPEIWLPYGEVEVAIDIKAENMGELIDLAQTTQEQAPTAGLPDLDPSKKSLILVGLLSSPGMKFLRQTIEQLLRKTEGLPEGSEGPGRSVLKKSEISILTEKTQSVVLRKRLAGLGVSVTSPSEDTFDCGMIDSIPVQVSRSVQGFDNIFLVSEVAFDPFFGFSGGPVSMMKLIGQKTITEFFKSYRQFSPRPGELVDSHSFCESVADSNFSAFESIEIFASETSVPRAFAANIIEAHRSARSALSENHTKNFEKHHGCLAVSPGSGYDTTLFSSLNCIWNLLPALKSNGTICVIAECSGGLGSQALDLVVTGRLELPTRKDVKYVGGLEQILALKDLQQSHEVCLVSSLPRYFVHDKLKIKPLPRARSIVDYAIQKEGARAKVAICTSGTKFLLKPEKRMEQPVVAPS
jgi:hypothetical protein